MPSKSIAHVIPTSYDTTFQRYYAVEAADLRRLYENAKRDQWNASSDIDWTIEVDPAHGIFADELIDGKVLGKSAHAQEECSYRQTSSHIYDCRIRALFGFSRCFFDLLE